jgi:hypothetical protein
MEGGPTFVHIGWCASARTELAVARNFVQLQRAHGAPSMNPNPSAATLALALSSKAVLEPELIRRPVAA